MPLHYRAWNDSAFFSALPILKCSSGKLYDFMTIGRFLPTENDEQLLDILLYSNRNFNTKTNQNILMCSLKFIIDSHRLTITSNQYIVRYNAWSKIWIGSRGIQVNIISLIFNILLPDQQTIRKGTSSIVKGVRNAAKRRKSFCKENFIPKIVFKSKTRNFFFCKMLILLLA